MCADKANKDVPYREFNDYDESVFISSNVKNIVLVSHIISCWKVYLDI